MAKLFKGDSYQIDPNIPISAIIGYSTRRGISLLRCIFFGIALSLNPKNLVFVGPCVELRNKKMISFGSSVTLGKGAIIDGLSKEGVAISNNVNIGPYCIIEATGVISDIGKGIFIGENSGIGAFSFIGGAGGVKIGKNVIMGQRVSFHSENHNFNNVNLPIREQGVTRKGIVIEDDCWVGANVLFLDGAHICSGSVIAAGSVVRDYIPKNSVIAGVPAKVIAQRGMVQKT
ncbi:MAG: acyltransferase [Proteobacteria bacterium]|nr:acyltransferase [Pseudomonadota bacterium]MBU1388040.1 acyltransferase [Pseudomonadota bacterium]MBU1542103.1 acyltransferase [Pseudomonadota bacterium]MBU2431710.1 acyltransferase [Pseudomonadota bacterium]